MSSLYIYCSKCRAANEPGSEYCHRCAQPLHVQSPEPSAQQQVASPRRISRRKAILTLMGITALPVGAAVAYLTYQKWTNPHILTYSGHSGTTLDAAWSPDSILVASSGWLDGGTVQIWNAATGKTLQICRTDHPGPAMVPLDVIWSADGKNVLAFVGHDRGTALTVGSRIVEMVQVWNAATGQRVRGFPVMEPVTVNAQGTDRSLVQTWALNERYLAAVNGQNQGKLEIWEIATGSKVATLSADSQHPVSQAQEIVWSPENEKLAIQWFVQDTTNREDIRTVEIWDVATLHEVTTLNIEGHYVFAQIIWAPDSRMLALVLEKSTEMICEIWDTLAGKRLQTFKSPLFDVSLITWSPKGKYLALGNQVYDVETGNRIITYIIQGMLDSLAWSPDGTRVAFVDVVQHGTGFSSRSSTLSVVDALSGRQRAKYSGGGLFGNSGTNGKLIWSLDGKYVMVVGQDIDIWRGE